MTAPVSKIWWLGVPLIVMVLQIAIELTVPSHIIGDLHSERGPHEMGQFLLLLTSVGVCIAALVRINWQEQKFLGFWFSLAAFCCFYVGGEEISWGQHILKWSTPDYWATINDQQETNLHNVSSWFDQKPRLLLQIAIYSGGLLLPLLIWLKPKSVPERFAIIYPPWQLFVVALCVLVPKQIQDIGEMMNVHLFARVSEVQELYMFYFVLLYLIALKARIRF